MILAGLSTNLFGLNHSYLKIDIDTGFGLLNGSINEFVFSEHSKNTDNMVSRLNWDVLTVPYFNIGISADIFKYGFISVNGRLGVPCASGVMQDYDWLNSTPPTGYEHWINDDPKDLTNYSIHYNEEENYFNISVKAGGNIPIGKNVVLTPYLGYEYDYIYFVAKEGYYKYKQTDFQKTPTEAGPNISYGQEYNALILGINCDFNFISRMPISTSFQVVPGLGKLVALDLHHKRKEHPNGLVFLDIYNSFFSLQWDLSVAYKFSPVFNLGLSSFIQYMPLKQGPSYVGPMEPNGGIPKEFRGPASTGGASRFLYGISFYGRIEF